MIGIIGQGFVGNAVYQKFKNYYDILTYDLDESKSNSTLNQISEKCETIFIWGAKCEHWQMVNLFVMHAGWKCINW